MEKIKELLKRLTEEFQPPNYVQHTIVLEDDNLKLYVFHRGKWFSGILHDPIDVEKDIEDVRNHIKDVLGE